MGQLFKPGKADIRPGITSPAKNKRNRIVVHELLHLKYPNHGKMFKVLRKRILQMRNN